MATLYFGNDGALSNLDDEGDDRAYFGSNQIPYLTGSQLRDYAATVYSESSFMGLVKQINPNDPIREMTRETFAVAYTMYTYAIAKGAAFKRANKFYGLADLLKDGNYTKGISSPAHQEYFGTGGDETRRKLATMAVIKLFTRQTQDVQDVVQGLQGAMYWDGNDLFRLYKTHFRAKMGFELGNSAHGSTYQNVTVIKNPQVIASCTAQNPKVSDKRQYTYMSSMTIGGTIFFKLHPQAVQQGITW